MKYIFNILTLISFTCIIASIGGIEHDVISIGQGVIQTFVFGVVMCFSFKMENYLSKKER